LGTSLTLLLVTMVLYSLQDSMIYHPKRYATGFRISRKWPVPSEIQYRTSQGQQTAFYVPPKGGKGQLPQRMWIMFNGNGSLALHWRQSLEQDPDPQAGFLLVEYPGYGLCEGRPSPETILESSQKAMTALAGHLHADRQKLYRHLNLLGFSLGTAAALQLAVNVDAERVVLVSPFTSMAEMARLVVGWPLCLLLAHRFDNQARLAELAKRSSPPEVIILHGDRDGTVPVEMSRHLARLFHGWIQYHELPGKGHQVYITDVPAPILASIFPHAERS
jgi:pimeloyl-ACP methyl ester carboxylesterase